MNYDALLAPSFLKTLTAEYGFAPSKMYGQNYLISQKPILAMLDAGAVSAEDVVVEVGPGFGVLTLALASRANRVVAFEIERALAMYWEDRKQEYPNIDVVWGNVLHTFSHLQFSEFSSYKVIANLPYQITSKIIRTFLEHEHPPERMVIMVQKEVAERIVAKPGDMSLLSVSVQYYGEATIVCQVPRGSFWPSPKVDSAVVQIQVHNQAFIAKRKVNTDDFFRVVRAGFSSKRKQAARNISHSLGIERSIVNDAFRDVCGNEKARAQELSVEEWERLVARLTLSDEFGS